MLHLKNLLNMYMIYFYYNFFSTNAWTSCVPSWASLECNSCEASKTCPKDLSTRGKCLDSPVPPTNCSAACKIELKSDKSDESMLNYKKSNLKQDTG